jgi:hypothetical protein
MYCNPAITSAGDVERLITRQLATSKLRNFSLVRKKGRGHLVVQGRLTRNQTDPYYPLNLTRPRKHRSPYPLY